LFNVDLSDIKQLTKNLKEVSRSAYPLAVRATLNKLAFETSKTAKSQLKSNFTVRNTYIQRTIQYKSCENTFKIEQMESRAGQVNSFLGHKTDQLEHQEYGKPVISQGKYTKTPVKGARVSSSYERIVRGANYKKGFITFKRLVEIGLIKYPTKDPKKQLKQAGIALKNQGLTGGFPKMILLSNSKGYRGIYSFKIKKPKLLYTLHDKLYKIKKTPWLQKALLEPIQMAKRYFIGEGQKRIEKVLAKGLKG